MIFYKLNHPDAKVLDRKVSEDMQALKSKFSNLAQTKVNCG